MAEHVVFVDAGHGGADPGAVDGTANDNIYSREAVYNLDLALKYGTALKRCGIRPIYSRTTDTTISLQQRTSLANQSGAKLLVSWHCNAHYDGSPAKGIEVFHYPGSASGKKAASAVFNRLDDVSPWADRGVKEARFYVLRHTTMPAILIEADFVTSTEAEAALASPAYRLALAEAAARGTCEYLGVKYVPRGSAPSASYLKAEIHLAAGDRAAYQKFADEMRDFIKFTPTDKYSFKEW